MTTIEFDGQENNSQESIHVQGIDVKFQKKLLILAIVLFILTASLLTYYFTSAQPQSSKDLPVGSNTSIIIDSSVPIQ